MAKRRKKSGFLPLEEIVQNPLTSTTRETSGELTSTRDYNVYTSLMEGFDGTFARFKFDETKGYIRAGRIGDIGCGGGLWLFFASQDKRLRNSELYGVDISPTMIDLCNNRFPAERQKKQGYVPINFILKNAADNLLFEKGSMDTIYTSSVTHEIFSYFGEEALERFIGYRYEELAKGGVWINRDVVGPENRDEIVYMGLNKNDGQNEDSGVRLEDRKQRKQHLEGLSTSARFRRFAQDFRHEEGYSLEYEVVDGKQVDSSQPEGAEYVRLRMEDACEFMEKKDYTDNWESEMHERFCYRSLGEWKEVMEQAGFRVRQESSAFANPWTVKNRFDGKVELYRLEGEGRLARMDYPVTNMIMVAEKV